MSELSEIIDKVSHVVPAIGAYDDCRSGYEIWLSFSNGMLRASLVDGIICLEKMEHSNELGDYNVQVFRAHKSVAVRDIAAYIYTKYGREIREMFDRMRAKKTAEECCPEEGAQVCDDLREMLVAFPKCCYEPYSMLEYYSLQWPELRDDFCRVMREVGRAELAAEFAARAHF